MTKKVLASLIVALALGCSTSAKRLELVREGRALLRHPQPGDAEWDARRVTFLGNADEADPPATPKKEGQ